jgi:hypothetical protein
MAGSLTHRHHPVMTKVAAMPSVARVAYMPLKAFAVNVIAIYSRARPKRHKPDSVVNVDPRAERLYSLDELTKLRRTMLRYARSFPPGAERNHHRQVALSLRRLFRNETWLRDHVRNDS